MPTITDSIEAPRGCGYRKKGGTYLVSDGVFAPCGKLPIPLTVCPTCSCGIKPARAWTWVDADALAKANPTCTRGDDCIFCPLGGEMGRAGLLWVGESFYKTPGEWTHEALKMGVSRRLHQIPKDFKLGDTWVLMAHRKVIERPCECIADRGELIPTAAPKCKSCDGTGKAWTPAIFHAFLPKRIEYVVKETETDEELERLEKRGFTLVRVIRDDGKPTLAPGESDNDDDESEE